jgi:twitching motility protein PilJ
VKFNFLTQMKLWQKFALLGAVALALIAYPLFTVVQLNRETIETVRSEEAGLPIVKDVNALTLGLQDHRTTTSYFMQNDDKRAAPRSKAAVDVESALASLGTQVAATGDPTMIKKLADLKQDWVALKLATDARKLDSRQGIVQHTSLVNRSIAFIEDVTAWSLIDLDPEAGAYYVFRASLIDLPQLSEAIRGLRSPVTDRLEELARARKTAEASPAGFNLDAAVRDALRPDDRARILKWVEQGERAVYNYGENMRKGMAASADLKAEMSDTASEIVGLSAKALQMVRQEVLGKEVPSVEAETYLKDVSVSRAAVLKASANADKVLTAALARRAATAQRSYVVTVGGELLLALIGLVIAVLIVRNITGTVSSLQGAVQRVRDGDSAALQAIESKDEVGDLGRTVNLLLTERIAAQQKAESENEQLNNSVVTLLGTMFELSQRNLTARAQVTTDVVGTVADSVNMLAESTSSALKNVNEVANEVAASSQRMSSNAMTLSDQAQLDRKGVLAMSDEIAQASTLMQQVAALAEQSRLSAQQATLATVSALKSVTTTVGEMTGIRDSIGEMEKRVKRLGERSQEISQVVALINSISERTHVLALNASMQAAMAGEAGRGFAVVTEEVQRLADSSRSATMQIAQLAQNIQLETSETVAALNRTVTDVVRGSQVAETSGGQMRETEQATQRLVEAVGRIANESAEQLSLAQRLAQRALALTASTEQTERVVQGTSDDAASLAKSSVRLVEVVSEFKFA